MLIPSRYTPPNLPVAGVVERDSKTDKSFAAVADFAPSMMWLSTRDGGRTFFNKTWLDFTGRALGSELGMGWAGNIHDEDRARATAAYRDGVRSGRSFELEYRLRRADGAYRHVLDCAKPSTESRGVDGFVGSCLDITERTTAELAVRQSERQLRLLAAKVEEARENERALIARELHDELGQSLTAIKFELARTIRGLTKGAVSQSALDALQSVVGGVDVATETVRRLATSLRPPALDHLGLVDAIELEAAALGRRTGIRCRVAGNKRLGPLTPVQTTGLFRIVQEALTNTVRHAGASAITIWIHGTSAATSLKVQDNGRGMVWDSKPVGSAIGLIGMHERADAIGGRLTIQSAPGKGTSVRIVIEGGRRPTRSRKW
jgi:two-component system, NarL family, sensor histidine kinase UhpB